MLRKLQTALVVAWGLLVLIIMAFNWSLVWQEEVLGVLFMNFSGPWRAWGLLGSLALLVLLRLLGGFEARLAAAKLEQKFTSFKVQAFDGRDAELEQFAVNVQEKLMASLAPLLAGSGSTEGSASANDRGIAANSAKPEGAGGSGEGDAATAADSEAKS